MILKIIYDSAVSIVDKNKRNVRRICIVNGRMMSANINGGKIFLNNIPVYIRTHRLRLVKRS
ncbi:Clas106 [Clostera anastomosis granulovirus B]|uniref:Clas106 n=1 Tax=Clostera anastomosis granulovirus B TaxID=1986290 RepID=A0A0K0WSB1_9BBAC|nr:Clas106 [Clostera anastomosis granulovirus B]AKS25449.1 Clas106 [Clostera anastomosis granulovirus B]